VAERLRHASVEGRLSTAELEDRLGTLYSSRTYGELDSLVADLPATAQPRQPQARVPRLAIAAAALTMLWAILGVLTGPRPSVAVSDGWYVHHGRFAHLVPALHHPVGLIVPAMVGTLMLLAVFVVIGWLLIDGSRREPTATTDA
jgi:hypothetical protein